jgi:hypothetical protein
MALTSKQQYNDPRWFALCDRIKERDNNKCRVCNSSDHNLEVHHLYYLPGHLIWEYEDEAFISACKCHHELLNLELPKLAGLIAFRILTSDIDVSNIDYYIKLLQNLGK